MKTRDGGFFSFLLSANITAKTPQILPHPHSKTFSPYLISIPDQWKLNNLTIGFVGESLRSKAGKMPALLY
jgi:hypothetical protein